MREILFRGRTVPEHRWVEGSYYYEERYDSHWILTFDGQHTAKHLVDPATVGQYTGLTDKNGVKIFEGNIVKITMPLHMAKPITYTSSVFWEFASWCAHWGDARSVSRMDGFAPCVTFEVIGNIHESPLDELNDDKAPGRAGEE